MPKVSKAHVGKKCWEKHQYDIILFSVKKMYTPPPGTPYNDLDDRDDRRVF